MRKTTNNSILYSQVDVQSENFDGYFELNVKQMAPEQKNKIPDNLKRKLISAASGKVRPDKLTFSEKLFVLQKAFDKRWYVVIEGPGESEALSIEHYTEFKKESRFNEITNAEPNLLLREGAYVLADREMARWMFHLNDVCVSGSYNYALKIRNVKPQSIYKERKALLYFINILLHYEGNKRKIVREFEVSIPEFCCLLYLYDGQKKKLSTLYEDIMANSTNINKYNLLKGITRLVDKKYVERFGQSKNTMYNITSFGINVINDLLVKHLTP